MNSDLEALNPLPPPSLSYAGSYGNTPSSAQLMPMGGVAGQQGTGAGSANSWSTAASGYNSLQYPSCGSGQYSSTPTMVLYPQLYSTVNQNQIHLHLHATATPDKIEQYLGSAASAVEHSNATSSTLALMPPGVGTAAERVEIGIGTTDSNNDGGAYDRSERDSGVTAMDTNGQENGAQTDPIAHQVGVGQESRDAIATESVWRPY